MAYPYHRAVTGNYFPGPQDVLKTLRKTWHRAQKRREVTQLLDKPEWILKDMGITRADVIEALAFKGDPSLHLRALAARRRFWQRRR